MSFERKGEDHFTEKIVGGASLEFVGTQINGRENSLFGGVEAEDSLSNGGEKGRRELKELAC